MIEFEYFKFSGDRFYVQHTSMPLNAPGITLLRGINYDAQQSSGDALDNSNGVGKSRAIQLLEAFIFGSSARGHFKRMVLPSFEGTLAFRDLKTGHHWEFSYTVEPSRWTILQNGTQIKISHKASDCQAYLQKILGLTAEDWSYFMCFTARSLDVLIKGQPRFKRKYLEEFFNIDAFYEHRHGIYVEKKKELEEELALIRTDRARIFDLQSALESLSGAGWLKIQIEACDAVLPLLKRQRSGLVSIIREATDRISDWNQYQELFVALHGIEESIYQKEQQDLMQERALCKIKINNALRLKGFLSQKLIPHQNREPKLTCTKPQEDCPSSSVLMEKASTVQKMRDKVRLKKQLTGLEIEIEDFDVPEDSLESLEQRKDALVQKQNEYKEHISLVEKGGAFCPLCKQSLAFILSDIPKDKKIEVLKNRLAHVTELIIKGNQAIKAWGAYRDLTQKQGVLVDEFTKFPVFGTKLSLAEADLVAGKQLVAEWQAYQNEIDAHTAWKAKLDVFLAEAASLGYPEDTETLIYEARIEGIDARLVDVNKVLKEIERFCAVSAKVIEYPPLQEIESTQLQAQEQDRVLGSHVDDLNVLKGSFKEKQDLVISYKSQIEAAKQRLSRQDDVEKEYRKVGFLADFYSSTGFKLYELKQRCKALIDRANHWSRFFFQEEYEWSLAEDLENLDLLVQPRKHKSEVEPYSVADLSAGEYNRAARVLLFSQLELIPPKKRTNLLFLDEVEAHLDKAGMRAFVEDVLPKLKENFPEKNIVIISHAASLGSSCIDHMWLAERKDRKTKLSLYPHYQRRPM